MAFWQHLLQKVENKNVKLKLDGIIFHKVLHYRRFEDKHTKNCDRTSHQQKLFVENT